MWFTVPPSGKMYELQGVLRWTVVHIVHIVELAKLKRNLIHVIKRQRTQRGFWGQISEDHRLFRCVLFENYVRALPKKTSCWLLYSLLFHLASMLRHQQSTQEIWTCGFNASFPNIHCQMYCICSRNVCTDHKEETCCFLFLKFLSSGTNQGWRATCYCYHKYSKYSTSWLSSVHITQAVTHTLLWKTHTGLDPFQWISHIAQKLPCH